MIAFEAKMGPKMEPGVGETVGNFSGPKCLQEAPGASKKTPKIWFGGVGPKGPEVDEKRENNSKN